MTFINAINKRLWYLALLSILCSFISLGGSQFWFLDLFSHFQLQYLIIMILASLSMILCRDWKKVLICSLGSLFSIWMLLTHTHAPSSQLDSSTSTSIKMLQFNVNTSNTKYSKLIELIQKENPDLVLLIELNKAWSQNLRPLESIYPYQIQRIRSDNFGIKLYSKKAFVNQSIVSFSDLNLPSIHASIEFEGKQLEIIGTHAIPPINKRYWQDRNKHLSRIAEKAKQTDDPLIVVGDLNITAWSPSFAQITEGDVLQVSVIDTLLTPSWPSFFPPLWIPIDHVLFNKGVQSVIRSYPETTDLGSDHIPIMMEISLR
ncbi:MAG: endonuclease/exonuclease/phosphatase family protein [Pseudobacteriovorax sp.]|nr:endonuclease/exonuclease/phosphatase family protein [Pseudobacteriovorax sp.]